MLELNSLTKIYDINSVPAVLDVNLKVEKGEIFGFIGPNGAGKSTVIKMITGILKPTQGEVFVDGMSMSKRPVDCKKIIGYVPDNPDIYERLTGNEYLNFMADVYDVPVNDRKERINKYIKAFGIESAINQQIKSFSHGMRQKLVITAALVHQPKLWILDEPMVGLDPMAVKTLKDEMKEHCKKGNTVFFSTHILEVAEKLCDRVGIINRSELVAIGTVEELKAKANTGDSSLEDVFMNIVKGN
ncbi:MAG: ABC transporter ATP-binding protein [Ruminococcaceae bacterium]|nr:ABC transporter ATP-binding protein [Oscillospiraceae bacterium]